jgi:hypothetical protein
VIGFSKVIPKIEIFAEGLVRGNPVVEQIRERGTVDPDEISAAVASAPRRAFGEDPISIPLQAIGFSARRPS